MLNWWESRFDKRFLNFRLEEQFTPKSKKYINPLIFNATIFIPLGCSSVSCSEPSCSIIFDRRQTSLWMIYAKLCKIQYQSKSYIIDCGTVPLIEKENFKRQLRTWSIKMSLKLSHLSFTCTSYLRAVR